MRPSPNHRQFSDRSLWGDLDEKTVSIKVELSLLALSNNLRSITIILHEDVGGSLGLSLLIEEHLDVLDIVAHSLESLKKLLLRGLLAQVSNVNSVGLSGLVGCLSSESRC